MTKSCPHCHSFRTFKNGRHITNRTQKMQYRDCGTSFRYRYRHEAYQPLMERQIAHLLDKGLSVRAVARQLKISPTTVQSKKQTLLLARQTIYREPSSPSFRVASLYSGCGGMDLGFKQSGFDLLWANDMDAKACETYAHNLGNHIVTGDIATIDLHQIADCDVMLGGFPCQDFSVIGKQQGIETERGNLYRYFVEAVSIKNPKIFVAENVKGILSANNGTAIQTILRDFQRAGRVGYCTKYHVVNFAHYGVPQFRERVLLIGVRKDIATPFHIPKPTHNDMLHISAKDALHGVHAVAHNNAHHSISTMTRDRLHLIPAGGNYTAIPKDSPLYMKALMSNIYRRLHPDKPSPTIIANGGGGTWGYHYDEPRPLTNRERARLFGYPDDFIFCGSLVEVRRQIGNSVPPSGIQPFARQIRQFLVSLTTDSN